MKIRPVDNVYFGAHLPPKQQETKEMNLHIKTRELYQKEEYKRMIAAWLRSYGQVSMGEECIEPLMKVIDNTHKKILRERQLPDWC